MARTDAREGENTPTDTATIAPTRQVGATPEQVQEMATEGGAYQVRQDVDGPLLYNGVGAFSAGAMVPADHPGVEGWLERGDVLEPYVDPFTGEAAKVAKGKK